MSELTDFLLARIAEDEYYAHVTAVLRAEIDSALGDAWDEAVNAVAWALDNGPADSALPYVGKNNPYRPTLAATEGDVR